MSCEPERPVAGAYGKLPGHGDFLKLRLATSFVAPWDDWLQRGLDQSRTVLGEAWREAYNRSPIWRFVTGPGVAGPTTMAGVLLASVDAVNRAFPLTIVAATPAGAGALEIASTADSWFLAAEDAGIAAALQSGLAANRLLALALDRRASDNVTLGVIDRSGDDDARDHSVELLLRGRRQRV